MESRGPSLFAISDLHVGHAENREIVKAIAPQHGGDWLIVAGDVAETVADIQWALAELAGRFETVIWVPGNHELWTPRVDPVPHRGVRRYEHLVELCRAMGVLTPEDPYPVWHASGDPVTVVPMFLLYDYTFQPEQASPQQVVCTDEYLLHPDPYTHRAEWCRARVEYTTGRLAALDGARTVLVNHWPLVREPTRILRYPEFAQWCGTELTADWHVRFNATAVVYGHLHIPRTTTYDGVRFEEVSVGYPREWLRQHRTGWLRTILPA